MRYWIYRDAQIMGPFTREDISQVQGLSPDALVCPESARGVKHSEWKAAAEVAELSALFGAGEGLRAAPALELSSGGPPDVFDRISEEHRGQFDGFGYGGEWTSGVFEDPDFFRQWGALVEGAGQRSEEFEEARLQAVSLEQTVKDLEQKLARYEKQQNEILDRLNEKDRALEEKERLLKEKEHSLRSVESRVPELEHALHAALEDLRLALQRRGEASAPAGSPAAAEPPKPAAVATPAARPPSAFEPPAPFQPPAPIAPEPFQAPGAFEVPLGTSEPAPPSPLRVEAPAPAFPPPAPKTVEAPPPPPAVSAPAPRPRLELPAAVVLKTSTLEVVPLPFTPPAPKAAWTDLTADPLPEPEAQPEAVAEVPRAPEPVEAPSPAPEPETIVYSPRPAEPPATMVRSRPRPEPEDLPSEAAAPEPFSAGAIAEAPAPQAEEGPEPVREIPPPEPLPLPELPPAELVPMSDSPSPEAAAASSALRALRGPETPMPEPFVPGLGPAQPPRTTMRTLEPPSRVPAASGPEGLMSDALAAAPAPRPAVQAPPAPKAGAATEPGPQTARRRRQSKTSLIILATAATGLMAVAVNFFSKPKDLVQYFTMAPKKTKPIDPDHISPAPTSLSQVKPVPVAPAPAPPPPAPGPGPGPDYIKDTSIAAIEFAMKHPLPGGKGSIGQWLKAAYLKPGSEEEWSAGAVEASVYVVSYRAFKGGKAAKLEPVTYLFEADLDKKTIKGRNPAARELLAGAASKPAAREKRVRRSRKAAPEPAAASDTAETDELLDLPSDDALRQEPLGQP
ncbi:MAG: hypothetical protein HY554_08965 [Elusimicrobia bacterium]|nr:hypothetical protein [Elusimicrobiota bacterium]